MPPADPVTTPPGGAVFAPLDGHPSLKLAQKKPLHLWPRPTKRERFCGYPAEGLGWGQQKNNHAATKSSNHTAWRVQCLHHLASPVMTPLGEPSNDAAWRAQYLRRLAVPVFTPLGEPSHLVSPAFTPFNEPSNDAAWRHLAWHNSTTAGKRRWA